METNNSKLNTGFFFLCLGLLITLITSVTSFLNLVFETLNKRFPDVLNASYQYGYSTYEYESIRMALATLIIFFPAFLIISYFWEKFTKTEMGHIDHIIRKWVIYIILFLSAVVLMVDLVALIKYFISGEITTRFILKVVVVLMTAVIVGKYYILSLRNNQLFGFYIKKSGLIFSCVSAILVVGAIVCSFSIMDSPAKQRLLRLDDRRIGDLQNIQYQIINYWQQKEKLPAKLSDLSNPLSGYSLPIDPEFEKGNVYEYLIKDKMKFELCATFALPIPKGWREYNNGVIPMISYRERDMMETSYPYPSGGINESWDHQSGRACFERIIDKDIYPPYPKSAR
ncbi:hypothetical protein A3B84_02370 [Candidatus Nomurabacteria bacterium RIFCSPHIGHO2_02_FULL_35_13]|uniref:DUF5671 domain-containing protein n=1 Tax=Candidatus Nomurabacteria bacterium RIFCSPHIGHO2_02_FULL_35_13 TaxID=1801748 RepID=A0A1F6VN85_9BACT|nr:MAG: hypothetical protein A3B84_02370 [Candidatus Nomurabacteria bacterium RIFCSPHIGHO2_02_FULL_35_13]